MENFSMYRMTAPGTTRPSRSSGRRRLVCLLMAAAATREDTQGEDRCAPGRRGEPGDADVAVRQEPGQQGEDDLRRL